MNDTPKQNDTERLRRENEELKARVRELEDRAALLERQLAERTPREDGFIEGRGVLWRRAATGALDKLVYCRTCKLVMTPVPSDYPTHYVCTRCGVHTDFGPDDLEEIMRSVSGVA